MHSPNPKTSRALGAAPYTEGAPYKRQRLKAPSAEYVICTALTANASPRVGELGEDIYVRFVKAISHWPNTFAGKLKIVQLASYQKLMLPGGSTTPGLIRTP